ncbi:hypothetical protein, partial [Candidatus Methylacidiphilum fumarolicum]
ASRAYSGETARREARNSIPEPSGLDGVVHSLEMGHSESKTEEKKKSDKKDKIFSRWISY